MPAAIPDAERPHEPPVKTIQTTINSKITAAASVRTRAPPQERVKGRRPVRLQGYTSGRGGRGG